MALQESDDIVGTIFAIGLALFYFILLFFFFFGDPLLSQLEGVEN